MWLSTVDVACSLPENDLLRYLGSMGPVARMLTQTDDEARTAS
jgi:hypothetical protein